MKSVAGLRELTIGIPTQYSKTLEAFLNDLGVVYVKDKNPIPNDVSYHLIEEFGVKELNSIIELCELLEKNCA